MFLSGHWTLKDKTILQKDSPKSKHFDILATESASEHFPNFSKIPVDNEISQTDVLSDQDIEFTNIALTREEMIKG